MGSLAKAIVIESSSLTVNLKLTVLTNYKKAAIDYCNVYWGMLCILLILISLESIKDITDCSRSATRSRLNKVDIILADWDVLALS